MNPNKQMKKVTRDTNLNYEIRKETTYNASTQLPAAFTASEKREGTTKGKYGVTFVERATFLTGSTDKALQWHHHLNSTFVIYEVFGIVIAAPYEERHRRMKVLIRSKLGPILQVIYYIDLVVLQTEAICVGLHLRCIGRMIGANLFMALKMRKAEFDEVSILPRHAFIGDYATKHHN